MKIPSKGNPEAILTGAEEHWCPNCESLRIAIELLRDAAGTIRSAEKNPEQSQFWLRAMATTIDDFVARERSNA